MTVTKPAFYPFTQLSHLWKWIVEEVGEEKETKRERKDRAKLVESRTEAQGYNGLGRGG